MRILRTSLLLHSRLPLPHSHLRPSQATLLNPSAPFSTTPSPLNANDREKKSSLLDREAVNTESNEYSKSGSDSGAAHDDPAFETGRTDPESELRDSKPGENGRDPLDVSPANKDVSEPRDEKEGQAERGENRQKASGGGGRESKGRKVG
jgi:hypothetical protein